ncbi:MAG: lysophospholipid acyltransferase family protein [Bacteroidales bacterium]|nr:lysophospholipid acyltransferase family protein [Bacteroidales bacterium]
MIRAKHHVIIYPFFRYLTRYLINRQFHSIYFIELNKLDSSQPILLIANHISWWDGFWFEYLNQQLLKKNFYFMMLEEQLKKYWFFRYTGGFSVKRNSRTAIDSLDYTVQLLKDSQNLVLIFPQGKIHSVYNNEIIFQKGIEKIIKNINKEIQITFAASFIDFFNTRKLNVFIYLKTFNINSIKENNIELSYQEFYNYCLNMHKNKSV